MHRIMKITTNITVVLCLCFLAVSCENQTFVKPKAAMTVNKTQLTINESMEIRFTGTAEQVVIFTGDRMHNYQLRKESNTGFVVNKGLFTYAYTAPGVYRVVCVASSYTDMAEQVYRDTCSYTITVTDDVTRIDKISCPKILYDEVFAENIGNDEWVMRLPRRVKYNTATPSISLNQRLRFYIGSDSTKVFVNGNLFSATAKYDLSNSLDIGVKSHQGTSRTYKMHTLYYPEFSTFKLAGVAGKLVRSEFNYSRTVMELSLPAATDLSNLVPEFETSSSSDKVFIDETEQVSGTAAVDFTRERVYKIIATHPNHPAVKAEMDVEIRIIGQ